jgi:predicted Zn finger-like uncharacterized protein
MLIICPSCATTYQVATETVGEHGRPVRCARCLTEWVAQRPKIIPALAQGDDLDVFAAGPVVIPPLDRRPDRQPPPGGDAEPEAASTDGIDVNSLQSDLAEEHAEEVSEADRVLAELTGETAATDAPSIVPPQTPDGEPAAEDAPLQDIEVVAARRTRRVSPRRTAAKFPRIYFAILALIACNAALLFWRENVVRLLPQTASLYSAIGLPVNLRGIVFADVHTSAESHDGVTVLIVDGAVIAETKRPVEVPRLRFSIRNQTGSEIYAWTAMPSRPVISPGERLPFRSRLASPPGETARVEVRFLTRADLSRGIQ